VRTGDPGVNLWVDYSSGRPGGAALAAAGIFGAARYVSAGSAGKLITAAEYADLMAHGIQVVLVDELNTHDAEGGFTAGADHARTALATARAFGIPDSVGIAAASDEHLAPEQIPTAVDYARGFASVLGVARTGAYGFAEFVDAVRAAGVAGWFWKCGSAPTAAEAGWVNLWQRNTGATTQTINGVVCDLNEQRNAIGDTVGNLQDTDPDWLQLTARVHALFTNLPTAGSGLSTPPPIPGEVNGLQAQLDALTALLGALQSTVAALSAPQSTAAPVKLTGTATIPIEIDLSAPATG
jgi:hypothetical protein